MMATNYSNKQNFENHWLMPTVSEVPWAARPQLCHPPGAPARAPPPTCFLGLGSAHVEPTCKTWYISRKSPDRQHLVKNGHLASAALKWLHLLGRALPVL